MVYIHIDVCMHSKNQKWIDPESQQNVWFFLLRNWSSASLWLRYFNHSEIILLAVDPVKDFLQHHEEALKKEGKAEKTEEKNREEKEIQFAFFEFFLFLVPVRFETCSFCFGSVLVQAFPSRLGIDICTQYHSGVETCT